MSTTDANERLRDIEKALRAHTGVREAVVFPLGQDAGSGDAAAVVPTHFATAPELREHVRERLGDTHSPQAVILLAELPVDDHGQPDVAAIKKIMADPTAHVSTYEEPRTATERELAAIFGEVLRQGRVGAADDFLELGGDSLHAVEVVTLIEQRMGVEVMLEELFDASTARALAQLIEERTHMHAQGS